VYVSVRPGGGVPPRGEMRGGVAHGVVSLAFLALWLPTASGRRPSLFDSTVLARGPGGVAGGGAATGTPDRHASRPVKGACPRELPVPWKASLPLRFPPGDRGNGKIPKIVHFVFLSGHNGGEPAFTFVNFAAVASALAVIRPEVVMVHCDQEPRGALWKLLRPHVRVMKARDVTSIFGNSVRGTTHKSDVLRLEILLQHGGIYMDTDIIALRSFDPLLGFECVMGDEEMDGWGTGLNSAVTLSAPNASFVRMMYESYRDFTDWCWNCHAVVLPKKLALSNPGLVKQLPHTKFHWPSWNHAGMKLMMDSFEYDYADNYAVHMWAQELVASPYADFSMGWCYECHSTLVSMLQAYVPDPLVSVVLPCEAPDHLEAAIVGALGQTFPSWELVVVADVADGDACARTAERLLRDGGVDPDARLVRASGRPDVHGVHPNGANGVLVIELDATVATLPPDLFGRIAAVVSHGLEVQEGVYEFMNATSSLNQKGRAAAAISRWAVPCAMFSLLMAAIAPGAPA